MSPVQHCYVDRGLIKVRNARYVHAQTERNITLPEPLLNLHSCLHLCVCVCETSSVTAKEPFQFKLRTLAGIIEIPRCVAAPTASSRMHPVKNGVDLKHQSSSELISHQQVEVKRRRRKVILPDLKVTQK